MYYRKNSRTTYETPDAEYKTPKVRIALYIRFDDDGKNGTIVQHIQRKKETWMETCRFFEHHNGSYEEALKEARSETVERTAARLVLRLWQPLSIEESENYNQIKEKLTAHYISILEEETATARAC